MLRRILPLDRGVEYDSESEFVTYTVESRDDHSRFIVMQWQDEDRTPEKFALINLALVLPVPQGNSNILFQPGGDRGYNRIYSIIERADVIGRLQEERTAYHVSIVQIEYLNRVRNIFETVGIIRANGFVQALNCFSDPILRLTGININPIELTASVIERIGEKKAENQCSII